MSLAKSASAPGLALDPKLRKLKKSYSNAGPAFFKNSMVGSSRGFFQTAGTILARPYKTGAVSAKAKSRDVGKSEYSQNYNEKRYCYSSMDNKPLQRYDPLAYRSRNALPDCKIMVNNSSIVQFDQGLHVDKKRQFYTTNGQYLAGAPVSVISNPGILSEQYKILSDARAK